MSTFLASLDIDERSVRRIVPSHSNRIAFYDNGGNTIVFEHPQVLDCDFPNYRDGIDGVITLEATMTVGVLTGDCVPLVIWSSNTGLFGVIHIGFVNLINGIAYTLAPLLAHLSMSPKDLSCFLGPSITKEDYDLSRSGLWSVISPQVEQRAPAALSYISRRDEMLLFDMHGYLKDQLVAIGISMEQIHSYPISTAATASKFYSNFRARRLDEPNGRFATIIARADR